MVKASNVPSAEPTTTEEWRAIIDWPYEASSLGRIRRSAGCRGTRKGLVLVPHATTRGYLWVRLYRDRVSSCMFVSRLVACAFLGETCGLEVNHKSGTKTDNRIENLEWVTAEENRSHAKARGLYPRGNRVSGAKLNEHLVRVIRRLPHVGVRRLAAIFGVWPTTLHDVWTGKTWR